MTGPSQVTWCPLCRRGEYCSDNERLMKQNAEINAELLAALKELTDAHAEMTAAVGEGSTVPFVPVLKRHVAAWEAARAAIKRAEEK